MKCGMWQPPPNVAPYRPAIAANLRSTRSARTSARGTAANKASL